MSPMRWCMSIVSHASRFLAVMTVLATSLPAEGATVRKGRVVAKPTGSTAIIPLPLQPIVPTAQRLCAAKTPSGLGYTILRAGVGAKPAKDASVVLNYIGYLAATGAVFDQGMSVPMKLDQVIAGFSEGVQLTGKTGVVRLCIPAAMGYGAQATGPIPANSALVFQVELIES